MVPKMFEPLTFDCIFSVFLLKFCKHYDLKMCRLLIRLAVLHVFNSVKSCLFVCARFLFELKKSFSFLNLFLDILVFLLVKNTIFTFFFSFRSSMLLAAF